MSAPPSTRRTVARYAPGSYPRRSAAEGGIRIRRREAAQVEREENLKGWHPNRGPFSSCLGLLSARRTAARSKPPSGRGENERKRVRGEFPTENSFRHFAHAKCHLPQEGGKVAFPYGKTGRVPVGTGVLDCPQPPSGRGKNERKRVRGEQA